MMYDLTKNKENINFTMSSIMNEGYICPNRCRYFWKPFNSMVVVECSSQNLEEIPRFVAPIYIHKRGGNALVKSVRIDLRNNSLLNGPSLQDGYNNVTELILSGNNIETISWIPPNIQILHLDQNKIKSLSDQMIDYLNGSSFSYLKLGGNPFRCDCGTLKLRLYSSGNSKVDNENVTCFETNLKIISAENLCTHPFWIIIILALVLICLTLCILACFLKCQKYIKMWLYHKGWCLRLVTEEELDRDKIYDVFLSFCERDENFVLGTILPKLESGPYKVCVHLRDWMPGELITKEILTSVKNSRRTLVIVSNNSLESCLANMEFRTAYTQAMTEGRSRVIVVLYGKVDLTQLDGDLLIYIKMTTYIKWEDPMSDREIKWFWMRIFYALPHKSTCHQDRNIIV